MLLDLICSRCGLHHEADRPQTVCRACAKPLWARYDLRACAERLRPEVMRSRAPSLWRYAELLPVREERNRISRLEGWTPLLSLRGLAQRYGQRALWLKEESRNPTGSFKARGLSVAISRALELGIRHVGLPSAGNAAGAAAAYAAQAGLRCTLFMPEDTPKANVLECRLLGAEVHLVPGTIADCARALEAYRAAHPELFSLATLREPYRLEGKKTLGYELFEQLGRLPDVVLYPTGGGTGLIGMGKAFDEMAEMGWIGPERPRLFLIQASGCAPLVRAFEEQSPEARPWDAAHTIASGLRVPAAIGDFLMLDLVRRTGGGALAVSDAEIQEAMREVAHIEGLLLCPEGAATWAAYRRLRQAGRIREDEEVVLFNTGSAYKYVEVLESLLWD
ncbi:MAG: threonine synthase [Bacteroidetes bacterium]|nr:threonine synthase [Bacteroidota bacterium]